MLHIYVLIIVVVFFLVNLLCCKLSSFYNRKTFLAGQSDRQVSADPGTSEAR